MKEVTKVTSFGFKITRWFIIFNSIPKNYHKSYDWFKMLKIVDHIKIKNSNLVQKHENGKLEKILSILTVCNGHPGCEQLVKILRKLAVFLSYLNKMSSGSTFVLSRMILIHTLWYLATKKVIFYLSLAPFAF